MSKFEVGEIAIVHFPGHSDHGIEVEIIGLADRIRINGGDISNTNAYKISGADGKTGYAEEPYLRKKKPPEIPRDKSIDNKVPWDYLNNLIEDKEEVTI